MGTAHAHARRLLALTITTALVALGGIVAVPSAARADTDPTPPTPATVSADALPTVQVNGVVWTQAIVGNTVYAGGSFTTARPAGAAPGTNETTRNNLLAYDLQTGALITSFAPDLNKQVLAVAASPDGSRIYVGGDFTVANGVNRYRIAAYSTATGQLITSFNAGTDYKVRTIVATDSTVYVGGGFSSINGQQRMRLAAFNASNGALTNWAPQADNNVMSMVLAPDNSGMILAGNFGTINGQQARGTAKVDLATGASLPWAMNQTVQNWGTQAAMLSLTTDGQQVFASGYVFGSQGNLEGIVAADPSTGAINWVDDCHGDTYWVWAGAEAVYGVGHSHYCGNIGGFPQTQPWSFQHAMAFSKTPVTTVQHDPYGYYDWYGFKAPDILRWWPSVDVGTFTGQSQAAWTVTGNSDYVLLGGEFPKVNGVAQQGLVRFAKRSIAPNRSGPVVKGAALNPNAVSLAAGSVRVAWRADWDRDNETLTYQLVRDNDTAHPIYTATQKSTFWQLPPMGYVDRGLVNGSTHRYKLIVTDPLGNTVTSENVTVTVNGTGASSAYSDGVLADGASSYWRLDEPSGTAAYDWAGFDDLTVGTGVARGAVGGTGDGDQASTFDGTDASQSANGQVSQASDTFTAEAWIKTTTTSGGKIIGFGGSQTGASSNYDRHVYMLNDGRIRFGTWLGFAAVVTSGDSYNDGQWHHVVATLGSAGEYLYVDGKRVGANGGVTSGQAYSGYWRVGGDNLNGWPDQPSSANFAGQIDDVAIYPSQLTFAQVRAHYTLSGRTAPGSRPADAYGQAVYDSDPDLYWRLGETTGTTAADASPNGTDGLYSGGYTHQTVSGVVGAPDGSVGLDGVDGGVASKQQFTNPQTYSEELWFRTTTHSGGKLIGFGNAQTGLSSGYDRHLYMFDDGRLRFGTWLGFTNVIDTPNSYNDGQWHHVVATGDASGLKLYVDGQLAASNTTGGAQDYSGYWRVGGDVTWGGNSSNYFQGDIDEVAVYSKVLSAATVQQHYDVGIGNTPNEPPTAAFSATVTDQHVVFDGSASSDPDGSIASYAWDFGDGQTGTGANPSHDYATAGTHPVTLTVTDNRGGTGQVTQTVVTTAPNQPPTAAFTVDVSDLTVSVDASTSTDSDGSVTDYAWDFGDGATASGAVPAAHTYATAGQYTITLTVTDDKGATSSTTQAVTATAPPNQAPTARFTSTTSGLAATVDASTSSDADGTVANYAWTFGDGATATGATPAAHVYAAAGTYPVTLTVTDDQGATDSVTHDVAVSEANQPPTARFTSSTSDLSATVDGSTSSDADGTIAGYAWTFGDGATATGATPAAHVYAAAGTYPVTLTVTDDQGATDSVTHDIVVTAPASSFYAQDLFGRTVSNGLGTADVGGPWTIAGGSTNFSVSDGQGHFRIAKAGATVAGSLESVSQSSTEVLVDAVADSAQTGTGTYITVQGRKVGADYEGAKVRLLADGRVTLTLVSVVNGAATSLRAVVVNGLTNSPSTPLRIRLQVFGTAPTTVRAKVWAADGTEPTAWTATATDSASALQGPGAVGLVAYLSGTSTNVPETVSFDNFSAGPIG